MKDIGIVHLALFAQNRSGTRATGLCFVLMFFLINCHVLRIQTLKSVFPRVEVR